MKLEEFKLFIDVEKERYTNFFKTISYNREDMIFNEGTRCNHLSFILEGGVSIRTYSVNGKEELINNLSEGDIFGDIICFAENRNYIGHVIAEKNSIIAHITRENWLRILSENPTILLHFIESITNKTYKTKIENKILAHKNIEDRIYYYLNTKTNNSNNNIVTIKNVTELSKVLNLPRPSVSRSLTIMEEKGLIKRNKNRIEVL